MRLFSRRGAYTGPVVYIDGVHRAVKKNGKPGAKLLWRDGGYQYWDGKGAGHHDRYHQRFVDLEMGGES